MLALKILFWTLAVIFVGYVSILIYCGIVNRRNQKSMSYICKFANYIGSLIKLNNDLSDEVIERYYQLGYADSEHVLAYIYFEHRNGKNKLEVYSTSNDLRTHNKPILCLLGADIYSYLGNRLFCLSKFKADTDSISDYNFLLKVLGKAFRLTCKCISKHFELVNFKRINFSI